MIAGNLIIKKAYLMGVLSKALFTFGLWNTGKYYLCKFFASFKRMIKSKGDLFGSVAQNTP